MGELVAWRHGKKKGVAAPLRSGRFKSRKRYELPKGFFLELQTPELFQLHKTAASATPVPAFKPPFEVCLGHTRTGLHAYIECEHRYFWMVFEPELTAQAFLAAVDNERALRLLLIENGIQLDSAPFSGA